MISLIAAIVLAQSYPDPYIAGQDQMIPLDCQYNPCIVVVPLPQTSSPPNGVGEERRLYEQRQQRLLCANHPEQCGGKKK